MVVVVGGSVRTGTTVVTVVEDELVEVELLDVVAPGTVVVGGGAFVTVKAVWASSVSLKA